MVSPEHRFSHLFAQKTMSTSSVSDIYSGLVRPMELDLPPLCHRSSSTAETLAVRRPEPPRHPRDEEASGLSESSQDVGRARVERGREGEMRMVWANWALSAKKCGAFGFCGAAVLGYFHRYLSSTSWLWCVCHRNWLEDEQRTSWHVFIQSDTVGDVTLRRKDRGDEGDGFCRFNSAQWKVV